MTVLLRNHTLACMLFPILPLSHKLARAVLRGAPVRCFAVTKTGLQQLPGHS